MAEIKRSDKGSGFQSAAGLMRYFDAEDTRALKIPPQAVFVFCIISVVIVGLAAVLVRV